MSRYPGNGRGEVRLAALALILTFAMPDVATAQALATLHEGGPVIVKLPVAPRDAGHRHTPQEIRDLALKARGIRESSPEGSAHVLFGHPMRKGITNPREGFYAISNYVDQDTAAPDMLLDYECGERTYDLDDGFNHNGVDYFNYPFSWLGMQQDASIVVAAADGVIIDKQDGEPDMNCAFNDNAEPNFVILEHGDGTVSIYLHFKQDSTTARAVGERVEKGDYLGVVGSSGFSTGPHLHFGVLDSGGNLIEPHAGACNSLNDDSWWENQEDYYETSLSFIATHSEQPEFPPCPGVETPHFSDRFDPGDSAIFSIFVRDALQGEVGTAEIRNANGATVLSFQPFEYTQSEQASAVWFIYGADFLPGAPSGS
ncbi:MAG: M23 family metallopeptidase, partial [Xanthomonadales bacterium]|nr:M23 family metallopeptidase [Xanthomonadales bacterium]